MFIRRMGGRHAFKLREIFPNIISNLKIVEKNVNLED